VADDEGGALRPPGQDASPGWHRIGDRPNLQAYWDGSSWTTGRRWEGAAWSEVPLSELTAALAARERPTTRTPRWQRRLGRSRALWVVLAVGLLGAVGGVVAVAVVTVGETPPPIPVGTTSGGRAGADTATTRPAASRPPAGADGSGAGAVIGDAVKVACQSDVDAVAGALDDYHASTGAFPVPAQPWGPASYAQDYAPLTSAGGSGGVLRSLPSTAHYVIEFDGSGHLWVEPAGHYTAAYDPSRDARNPDACDLGAG